MNGFIVLNNDLSNHNSRVSSRGQRVKQRYESPCRPPLYIKLGGSQSIGKSNTLTAPLGGGGRTLGCLEAVAEREGDHPPITLCILRITCYELGLDGIIGGIQEVLHPESKGEGTEAIVPLERE